MKPAQRFLVSLSLMLVSICAPAAQAARLSLGEEDVVYFESFDGEVVFPTTPEVDFLVAGGMPGVGPCGYVPAFLNASTAETSPSVVDPFVVSSEGLFFPVAADLSGRSYLARSILTDWSLDLGTTSQAGVSAGYDFVSCLSRISVSAYVVAANYASGSPPDVSLVVSETDFSTGAIRQNSVSLSSTLASHLVSGFAFTIELHADVDNDEFTGVLRTDGFADTVVDLAAGPGVDPLALAPDRFGGFVSVQRPDSGAALSAGAAFDDFEVLAEARVFAVDSTLDDVDDTPGDGLCRSPLTEACTLRAAIQESNALPGRDHIELPNGRYSFSIAGRDEDAAATGDLDVTDDLVILGSDPDATIVDAEGLDRVFQIHTNTPEPIVRMMDLTIEDGSASTATSPTGGGVENRGILTLERCRVKANAANLAGGIMNRRRLVLDGCVVSGNSALALGFVNVKAGGIASASTSAGGANVEAEIRNSAIVENTAASIGGIELGNCDSATLENTTVADNAGTQVLAYNCTTFLDHVTVAAPSGLGLSADSFTGNDDLVVTNSAFDGFPACAIATSFASQVQRFGNNASNDTSCGFSGPDDIENQALRLASPTQWLDGTLVRVPEKGSPLIDAGDDGVCLPEDQRRAPRPSDGDGDEIPRCDIGALEVPEPTGGVGVALLFLAFAGRMRARTRWDPAIRVGSVPRNGEERLQWSARDMP